MKGNIYLYGEIIAESEDFASAFGYVNLANVKSQVSALGADCKELNIHINSIGGNIKGGEEIHAYLTNLKSKGYTINTYSSGFVYSMGTYLFMIGDNRIAYKGDDFTPHMPLVSDYSGRANDLEETAKELRALEVKFSKYYSQNTNITESQAKTLLEKDESLDLEEALALGFITELKEKREIIAKIQNNMGLNIDKAVAFLKGKPGKEETEIKAVSLTLKSGTMVDSNSEVVEPVIGDEWTIEGENAPDGTHETEGGFMVTTESGKVTEVEKVEEVVEEVEEVAKTDEEVQAELEATISKVLDAREDKELVAVKEDLKETKKILAEFLAISSKDIDTSKKEETTPPNVIKDNRFIKKQ